ncbi:styrene monooxygenase/indole monooxygenase family protein [Rhodococcus sp. NPDC060176]|uniref:styrene monooxygenase/indole monooxygenase family protein n=1 Tax=Rhodococcus sp. NPDC060176 TaxID=3347062 RepID=UPI003647D876
MSDSTGSIGIVGTGIAGLHLALMLQQHGVPVTIYTDRTPEQVATGRLLNTVMHHHATRERDRELGAASWPLAECGWWTRYHSVRGTSGVDYRGNFDLASVAVDYRLYLPHLEREFVSRGGEIQLKRLDVAELEQVSGQHDLMVVATGRGPVAEMFGLRKEYSPYSAPQRLCLAALVSGVDRPDVEGVSINASRGEGELIEFPMLTAQGRATALLFENMPDSDLAQLVHQKYADDPGAFDKRVLSALEQHYPRVFERVRLDKFGILSGDDILQGGVTPVVRNDYIRLDSGCYALAVGDCHAAVDPLMGQGANAASYSALVTGQAILDEIVYDEMFCRRVAASREEMVLGATLVTNMYLEFPEHLRTLQKASVRSQEVANRVAAAFADPREMWRIIATPERVDAFVRSVEDR